MAVPRSVKRPPEWATMSHQERVDWMAENDTNSQAYKDRQAALNTANSNPGVRSQQPARPGWTAPEGTATRSPAAQPPRSSSSAAEDNGGEEYPEQPKSAARAADLGAGGPTGSTFQLHRDGEQIAVGDGFDMLGAVLRAIAEQYRAPS
jgi:hypothetical protein